MEGSISPLRDVETINLELIFADLEMLEKRIDKTRKLLKSGDKKFQKELDLFEEIKQVLEDGKPARTRGYYQRNEQEMMKDLNLLTLKPVLYAANVSEDDFANGIGNNALVKGLEELAEKEGSEVMPISARDRGGNIACFRQRKRWNICAELGITESGLDRLVKKSYKLLGLISYLTAGEPEVRAWTITRGTRAPQAAGKIHTDFEKGFIRAEVVAYR